MMDYMAAQEETTGDQELILNDNNDEDSVYIAALGDYLEDDAARTREGAWVHEAQDVQAILLQRRGTRGT